MSGGFKQKFFAVKRRTAQSMLMKLGKAQATPDDEYIERKAKALKMHTSLVALHKHCSAFLEHTRGT